MIVAHGSQADPVFFYGNQLALSCFELDFAAFTRLPSRYSAEPLLREERDALLARVHERGFIDDYAGVRVSATGRRFRIEQATVWNLFDGGWPNARPGRNVRALDARGRDSEFGR